MGAFTDDLETKLLDYTLKTANSTNYAQPTSLYVGLCTTAPTDSASGEYTSGTNGYLRKQIAFSTASSGSATAPTATCTFAQATGGSWGTIYGYAIFNHSTGTNATNYLFYGSLASNVTVNQNDTVEFATNAITLSYD